LAGEPFPGLTRNEKNGAPGRLNPNGPKRSGGPAGADFLFRDEGPKIYLGPRKKSVNAGFGRNGRRSVSRDQRPEMVVVAQAKSRERNGARNAGTTTRELNAPLIESMLLMI